MKLKILAAILAAPLWLATPIKAENSSNSPPVVLTQDNWSEFSSFKGGFAVSMPGTPKEETQANKNGSIEYSYSLAVEKTAYLIHYADLPEAEKWTPGEVQQLLKSAADDFTKEANAELVKTEDISLNGYPGREFEFKIGDGVNGKGRFYMVKQRLYIVVAMTAAEDDFQKFLNSFRLL